MVCSNHLGLEIEMLGSGSCSHTHTRNGNLILQIERSYVWKPSEVPNYQLMTIDLMMSIEVLVVCCAAPDRVSEFVPHSQATGLLRVQHELWTTPVALEPVLRDEIKRRF